MNKKGIIIAIDGPAGSGKSTTAKKLAEKLHYTYIDTGAMYRAVAYQYMKNPFEPSEEALKPLMNEINIEIKYSQNRLKTILNDEDISDFIRTPEVSKWASLLSAYQVVREKLVDQQRLMGEKGSVILDGRDIGTVVFPNAELKIFLIASIEARAERRMKELESKGTLIPLKEIKEDIQQRDHNDSSRQNSPLKKAYDAIEIDTSNLTINEQVEEIYKLATKFKL